jgi:hypothetical protein
VWQPLVGIIQKSVSTFKRQFAYQRSDFFVVLAIECAVTRGYDYDVNPAMLGLKITGNVLFLAVLICLILLR